MNYSNIIIFISSLTISALFFGGVFMNLGIKSSKDELARLEKEINSIKDDIKRQEIEISTLTNPLGVVEFANKNGLKTISIKNIKVIKIKK